MLVASEAEWASLLLRARQAVREAFGAGDRPLNLINREWGSPGRARIATSPVDGRELTSLPMLGLDEAYGAVRASKAAGDISAQLRSFKVGINAMRSRGDRDEAFGGMGQSWRGCFVGGRFLVDAVTDGSPPAPLFGNFADYTLLPERR